MSEIKNVGEFFNEYKDSKKIAIAVNTDEWGQNIEVLLEGMTTKMALEIFHVLCESNGEWNN